MATEASRSLAGEEPDANDEFAQRQAAQLLDLDAKVEREARDLSGLLDSAVADVQRWREQQAAKLEKMRRELESELSEVAAAQTAAPELEATLVPVQSHCSTRRQRIVTSMATTPADVPDESRATDENVDPIGGSGDLEEQRRRQEQVQMRRRRERPTSASQHLRLLAASEQASTPRGFIHGDSENRVLKATIAAKTEALKQADEEMERAASRLTEYSRDMDEVLARLQALG